MNPRRTRLIQCVISAEIPHWIKVKNRKHPAMGDRVMLALRGAA
jgi:hypothetical protein